MAEPLERSKNAEGRSALRRRASAAFHSLYRAGDAASRKTAAGKTDEVLRRSGLRGASPGGVGGLGAVRGRRFGGNYFTKAQ
jgi:hypothetical protein